MNELSVKKSRRCTDEEMLAFREEILETATVLFAEQGFSDAVTQALAGKLQVGKGTIYRHFASKRELFLAAADRVMQKLQERVEINILGITDGFERITKAVAAFLAFFAEHPQYVELLIQERAYFKDRQRPTYFEHREINIERLAAGVSRTDRRGTRAGNAGRPDHECREQHALRNHGHQLLQRPGQAIRRAGQRAARRRVSAGS